LSWSYRSTNHCCI